jgi:hypothetical protein
VRTCAASHVQWAVVEFRRTGKKSDKFSRSRYDDRMITIRDHQTGDLFNPWDQLGEKRRQLLGKSWAGVFRDHLLDRLPVHESIARFLRRHSRPIKDFHTVIDALILKQLHDLTDAATVEAIAAFACGRREEVLGPLNRHSKRTSIVKCAEDSLPVSLSFALKICDALGQQHVDLRFTLCECLFWLWRRDFLGGRCLRFAS